MIPKWIRRERINGRTVWYIHIQDAPNKYWCCDNRRILLDRMVKIFDRRRTRKDL